MSSPLSRTWPRCRLVWPITVPSKVVLPTPLRPITERRSPSASVSRTSPITPVPPYPAETPSSSSAMRRSAMTRLPPVVFAEIDRAHALVGRDLLRRAFGEHRPRHQHGDALGKAEHDVHVVLDDQYGD